MITTGEELNYVRLISAVKKSHQFVPTVQIKGSSKRNRISQRYCLKDMMVVKAQKLSEIFREPNLPSESGQCTPLLRE